MSNKKAKKKEEWTHCNKCGDNTKHRIVAVRVQDSSGETSDPNIEVWSRTVYEMLECGGCESVILKRTSSFSEIDEIEETYFPPAVSRRLPAWHESLSSDMQVLLKEIYTALHADSRSLAMMGTRALLDMLIVDKVGDRGTFPQKLDALLAEGVIGKKNRDFLEAALDAGSAASHRGHQPSETAVSHVMDILENLLQAVYVLESAADELKKTTPPRHRAGSTEKKP